MPAEKVEKLEKILQQLVAEVHRLEAENSQLSGRVCALGKEKMSVQTGATAAQEKLRKLGSLERSTRKMEKQQSMIRLKVKSLLENLEKIDRV